ncbi:MAG: hypothetical protein M3P49_01940 [Actinomycetota bacterium]|nr:hypothetical protein [Actinomycetota bacterium]
MRIMSEDKQIGTIDIEPLETEDKLVLTLVVTDGETAAVREARVNFASGGSVDDVVFDSSVPARGADEADDTGSTDVPEVRISQDAERADHDVPAQTHPSGESDQTVIVDEAGNVIRRAR